MTDQRFRLFFGFGILFQVSLGAVEMIITSPIHGGVYTSLPLAQLHLSFKDGPLTDAIQSNPVDFELCIDYGIQHLLNYNSSVCKDVLDPAKFNIPPIFPSDLPHKSYEFRIWLQVKPNKADSSILPKLDLINLNSSNNWWKHQGAIETVAYSIGTFEAFIKVLSPLPLTNYGGGLIPAIMEFSGPVTYYLCMRWHDKSPTRCFKLSDMKKFPDLSPEITIPGIHYMEAWITPNNDNNNVVGVHIDDDRISFVSVQYSTYSVSLLSNNNIIANNNNQIEKENRHHHFNESKIFEIYNQFGKPSDEYLNRDPIKSMNQLNIPPEGYNMLNKFISGSNLAFSRLFCVIDFVQWCEKHGLKYPTSLLSTYPLDYELSTLYRQYQRQLDHKQNSITAFTYGEGFGDLHTLHHLLPLPNEPFDLAIISQTLEHLYNPEIALINILKRLKKGNGCLFTSMPSISYPHMLPFHFQHYTPMGLITLLTKVGYEVKELGQWGNIESANKMHIMQAEPTYSDLKKPIENDPNVPTQIWALACRPH